MRKLSSIGFGILGVVMLGGAFELRAQPAPQGAPPSPVIEIVECVVYPEGAPSRTVDCAAKARAVCNGTAMCELPIGLSLTAGQQIDHAREQIDKGKRREDVAALLNVDRTTPFVGR